MIQNIYNFYKPHNHMCLIEVIIFYLILIDSLFANAAAWFFPKWMKKKYKKFWKHLPVTKGWAAIYLILVLWVGFSLHRLGVLF